MTGVSELGRNTTIKVWRGHNVEMQEAQAKEKEHESDDDGDDALVVGTIVLVGSLG